MRGLLIRLLLTALATASLTALASAPSYADGTVCGQTDPATGECLIWIHVPGNPGTPGTPGDDGPEDTGSGAACYLGRHQPGHHEATARAGPVLERQRVLVERLQLLHLAARSAAACR